MPAQWLLLRVAVEGPRPLLFDTCVLIDAYERRPTPIDQVPLPLRQTTVVAAYQFLRSSSGPRPDYRERKDWLADKGIRIRGFRTGEDAQAFRWLIGTARGPPDLADALIAAESIDRRSPLVTANDKHFEQVDGLTLVDWGA